MLVLPDGDARAEWLCKDLNEADTEALRKALDSDIHKLLDGARSVGRAFRGQCQRRGDEAYKPLGLEQLTRVQAAAVPRKALRSPGFELFSGFLALRGEVELDVGAVKMIFTRALPSEESER